MAYDNSCSRKLPKIQTHENWNTSEIAATINTLNFCLIMIHAGFVFMPLIVHFDPPSFHFQPQICKDGLLIPVSMVSLYHCLESHW